MVLLQSGTFVSAGKKHQAINLAPRSLYFCVLFKLNNKDTAHLMRYQTAYFHRSILSISLNISLLLFITPLRCFLMIRNVAGSFLFSQGRCRSLRQQR
jgi:hypothetical protein